MQKKKNFSGYPADCSEQQLQTLATFRSKVREAGCTDPAYDDTYLLRFLRARKFDLGKTMEMWTNFITWRQEKKIDDILTMEFPEMEAAKEFYPHGWLGTDKLGRPIFIERVGKLQIDKALKLVTPERLQLHYIQSNEKLLKEIFPACSKARGEPVNNTCYIMDLKGAAANMMSSKVWDLLKVASKIGQDYYPEILGHMYIVNAPMFFYGIWNIAKHFVDDKTRAKIHILGSGYKKELFKCVDESNLPDFLGGKLTTEDYGLHMTKEKGPWVSSEQVSCAEKARVRPTNNSKGSETEDERTSIELKDEIEDSCQNTDIQIKSLPVMAHKIGSIEELGDIEHFDIGQESPLKLIVRNFKSKPSMSFNKIPSLNGGLGVGI